ncbi:glycosyltransferase family 61 protein [Paramyrothecium foliicola]|nr:glycosyltransferase family 61 protein [Paramyrothecium foliicola]
MLSLGNFRLRSRLVALGILAVLLFAFGLHYKYSWLADTTYHRLWALGSVSRGGQDAAFSLPDYDLRSRPQPYCAARFSTNYLEDTSSRGVSYCSPGSSSNLTCFHTNPRFDGQIDSLCVGQGAVLSPTTGKFHLDCKLRALASDELSRGLIPFESIRSYWYDTGPPVVLQQAVQIGASEEFPVPSTISQRNADLAQAPPSSFFLIKREGGGNLWHSLMEIFSFFMTVDILRISPDPSREAAPLFNATKGAEDAQVIILDDYNDGPYFDLWTLFSQRKPLRLKEFLADVGPEGVTDAKIIAPLSGSSNPLWQDDEEVQQCQSAPTLSVFSQRVLGFYSIGDPPVRNTDSPIIITFINRQRRRLRNQNALLSTVSKNPRVRIRSVDFAAITLKEQLQIVQDTDILVGVHGAGITHAIFMREKLGAVVEIQPYELSDHYGFRNVANMRGLDYFRVHAQAVPSTNNQVQPQGSAKQGTTNQPRRRDWHEDDIFIEESRFLDIMDAAIKSMYNKGPWSYDLSE